MRRNEAIELASAFIINEGNRHGRCLSAQIVSHYKNETWEVEFAYDGMEERSPTTDPPSLIIAVESSSRKANLVTLM